MIQAIASLLSMPYCAVIAARKQLYRWRIFGTYSLPCKVVSIGNLTFGGTGKTPTVAWLAQHFKEKGLKVGILSRGYKADELGQNDESIMLADLLPDIPQVQNPDRIEGGKELISRYGVQIIILDDGFQHLRLARDLNILLVDGTNPFGGGYCPPCGKLREPLSGIARANVVILTRANLVDEKERNRIWVEIANYSPEVSRIDLAFKFSGVLETETGKVHNVNVLRGRGATLLCAIGNPKSFRALVENAGIEVRAMSTFRDHHHYTAKDIAKTLKKSPHSIVLTTHKDWVKLRKLKPPFYPWVLQLEPNFIRGDGFLHQRLDDVMRTQK